MTPIQAFLHRPIRTEPAGRDDVVCGLNRSICADLARLLECWLLREIRVIGVQTHLAPGAPPI